MPYEILFTDSVNKLGIVVEDGTVNQETSLKLPGKNTTSYGSIIAENFLHLLENFASTTSPSTPVEGQLWYDSSPNVEQLFVYNGVNWIPANGVNKSITAPTLKQEGDLWIDRENLQLYMYTDAGGWILIGPEYSDGVVTGPIPKSILGIDDILYNILQIDIAGKTVAIFAKKAFTPKVKIDGFSTLYPGMNLSNNPLPGEKSFKYYGIAEKAESLIVGQETVSAGNFLRSDAVSTSNFQINVLNNKGVLYGLNSELEIGVEGSNGVIKHNVAGASIDVKLRNDGLFKTLLRFDSSMKVGINNDNPDTELSVTGDVNISVPFNDSTKGNLFVQGTADSTRINNGSIVTAGGIGVAQSVTIGGNLYLNHTNSSNIIVDKILPTVTADELFGDAQSYIGSPSLQYESIYAKRFYGDLTGTVTGSVTGRAGSANKLAKASTFKFIGDVGLLNSTDLESGIINFTGQGELVEFQTEISQGVVSNKIEIIDTQLDDELLISRNREDIGLKKISIENLLKTVPTIPIGSITPYAGLTVPAGWLLCAGQNVLKVDYEKLFAVIGYTFASIESVPSGYFTLPDLRGRFPLGLVDLANPVLENTNSTELGGTGGNEKVTLQEANLPDHKHDLFYNDTQFYATAPKQFEIVDDQVEDYHFYEQQTEFTGVAMKNTQGIVTDETLSSKVDILNPFLALNFIIYAG